MIEKLLRAVFKAPTIDIRFTEDEYLPSNWVTLDEKSMTVIGVEPGDEAIIGSEVVVVMADDEAHAAPNIIAMYGHGPLPIRRRVLTRLARHLIGGAWTLAGMVIVVLTLSATVQVISLGVCLLFFAVDLMSISLRRP